MPMTAYHHRLIDMVMFLKHVLHAAATKVIPMDIFQHSIFAIVVQALRKLPIRPYSVRIRGIDGVSSEKITRRTCESTALYGTDHCDVPSCV